MYLEIFVHNNQIYISILTIFAIFLAAVETLGGLAVKNLSSSELTPSKDLNLFQSNVFEAMGINDMKKK